MNAILTRQSDNGIQTLGDFELWDNDKLKLSLKTLELPDKNNQSKISCIPKGIYKVIKVNPTENIQYKHFWISSVEGRSGIKIHKGNYHTQILGCVLIGLSYSDINNDGQLDVIYSGKALDKLLTLVDEFELKIQ